MGRINVHGTHKCSWDARPKIEPIFYNHTLEDATKASLPKQGH